MVNNLLGAAEVFRTIGSILLAVFILLVMITIHEFGHYLAGKAFHFKINEFSIGFGPAIFKKKSKKTGEQFSIRIVPLGGYCAFEGEDGLEVEEKDENGEIIKHEPDPNAFTKKKPWQRIIVLLAGATMNYLLALLLITINTLSYGQMMTAVYKAEAAGDIPAEYCLQDGDIFLSCEGNNLYLTTDIVKAVNGKKQGTLVSFTVSRVTGKDEEGKNIREEREIQVMLRSDATAKSSADADGIWKALGVAYSEEHEAYWLANAFYKFGFFPSVGRSFVYSFKIAGSIFTVIGELFTGRLGLNAFGGPITTISMTSQIATMGFRYFLEIAGFIGVNLAVFNLLPIPALDGSKIVFTLIEWIRGKPINRKAEAIIHTVGLLLLFGFAILVDILQFI